jgi:hypothetical protein
MRAVRRESIKCTSVILSIPRAVSGVLLSVRGVDRLTSQVLGHLMDLHTIDRQGSAMSCTA